MVSDGAFLQDTAKLNHSCTFKCFRELVIFFQTTEIWTHPAAQLLTEWQHRVVFIACTISQSQSVKNLGIFFDPSLTFDPHIKNFTKSAFFHLCNTARIRPILSISDAEILLCIHSLNPELTTATRDLQLVQNAAATILTRSKKFDHICPILMLLFTYKDLINHWVMLHYK